MPVESLLVALPALLSAAARAAVTSSAPEAITTELRRVLDADVVEAELLLAVNQPTRWRAGRDPRDPVTPTDASPLAATLELAGADAAMGTLSIRRDVPLSETEHALARACADMLVIGMAREARLADLEREVSTRVREVAEQRAFIERVVDSLPFGLYVVDRDYRIHAWNHKRETGLQGVSRTDAIGRTIFEVLHRQPAAMLKGEFDDVFASGRLQQFEMESNAFGDTRTFRISKIPMRLHGDVVSHVITVGEDITDWRAALDRTSQSEKLAALGQLAAGVMHEINNPLATIAACGEALAMHRELSAALPPGAPVPGSDPAEMLRIIDLEVQRCKRIANGLLDFARPKPAHRATLDLNAVVQQALFLLQHHPRFKRVRMEPDLEASQPLFVTGSEDQLVQVLLALAINAIDATPEGSRVVIRTRALTGAVGERLATLDVADEGPGVPRALQAKVFEPFFTTKAPGQGTGLGLAICYGIVTDHGGQLQLVSGEGQGATFRVQLPVVDPGYEVEA